MDIVSVGALIGGIICIVAGMVMQAPIKEYWDAGSVFITIGGTFCALFMSYPLNQIKDAMKGVSIAFKKNEFDPTANVEEIISLANMARRDGLLALENVLDTIKSPFLRKGIMLVVDGSNSELVKSVMETEIDYIQDRHNRCIAVFNAGAAYAPAFGMAGTLIGLIAMLLKLEDMASLGPAMAVALVTTFYGVLLANLFFTPISKKLKILSSYEQAQNELMLEGILSIQDGENPRLIRDKLDAFISTAQSKQLDAKNNADKHEE